LISVQLLFMYTCVSNVYVSGKKILSIPETMPSISTSAESKQEKIKNKS
jgi:hypothetical protein